MRQHRVTLDEDKDDGPAPPAVRLDRLVVHVHRMHARLHEAAHLINAEAAGDVDANGGVWHDAEAAQHIRVNNTTHTHVRTIVPHGGSSEHGGQRVSMDPQPAGPVPSRYSQP